MEFEIKSKFDKGCLVYFIIFDTIHRGVIVDVIFTKRPICEEVFFYYIIDIWFTDRNGKRYTKRSLPISEERLALEPDKFIIGNDPYVITDWLEKKLPAF